MNISLINTLKPLEPSKNPLETHRGTSEKMDGLNGLNGSQRELKLPNKIYKQINWVEVIEHLIKTKPENWKDYHIDHVRPLSSFDLTDQEQLRQANHYSNLQWLRAKDNISKGGKY